MSKLSLTVPPSLEGARLDKAIVALAPNTSRARVKRAIDGGQVRVNGRSLPKGGVLHEGDVIEVDEAAIGTAEVRCVPEPAAPLDIRHESSKVLVVHKPAGQATAPLRPDEVGTLANALLGRFAELSDVGYSAREPGIVHRLDTETSGLVVVARTKAAFEALREALKDERIGKEYLLVCPETGLPDRGSIEYPIANHPKDKKRVYPCIHPRDVMRYEPRAAITTYEVQERSAPWALVKASASRAVRHQIRAHFSAIGHPLAGDLLYGGEAVSGLERHALHAFRVSFDGGGDPELAFDVTAALPDDLSVLVR
jgi:23S rRNA pseudouridine1911/1915/1917 synthase